MTLLLQSVDEVISTKEIWEATMMRSSSWWLCCIWSLSVKHPKATICTWGPGSEVVPLTGPYNVLLMLHLILSSVKCSDDYIIH